MPIVTTNQVSVQRFREEDRPLLEQMYDTLTLEEDTLGLPPRDSIRRQAWLASLRTDTNFVASLEGRIVGHLALMPVGHSAEMALFVHQDFRRQGIATALARAAVEDARSQGLRFIWVWISGNNSAARIGLYKFRFHTVQESLGEVKMMFRL